MSDAWRIKRYYEPRQLVQIDDALDSTLPCQVVCLSGGELTLLRSLLAYANYRSTWVDEYHEGYYLAPDNTQWDDIQAFVAELEHKLMGCDDIAVALDSIASRLACICAALQAQAGQGSLPSDGFTGQEPYDTYRSPVVEDDGSPPAGFGDWDAWREYKCQAAQKLVDDVQWLLAKQGTRESLDILVTWSMLNAEVASTILLIPVALVVELVIVLLALSNQLDYLAIDAWIIGFKHGIVCQIYNAHTSAEAYAAVQAYIDAQWFGGDGLPVVKSMFTQSGLGALFDGTLPYSDNWLSDYDANYCDDCTPTPSGSEFVFTWPPCPNGYFSNSGACEGGLYCLDSSMEDALQNLDVTTDPVQAIELEVRFRSNKPAGWTVGAVYVDVWDDVGLVWTQVASISTTTLVPAGDLTTDSVALPVAPAEAAGLWRVRAEGSQPDVSPYALQFEYIRVTFSDVPPP